MLLEQQTSGSTGDRFFDLGLERCRPIHEILMRYMGTDSLSSFCCLNRKFSISDARKNLNEYTNQHALTQHPQTPTHPHTLTPRPGGPKTNVAMKCELDVRWELKKTLLMNYCKFTGTNTTQPTPFDGSHLSFFTNYLLKFLVNFLLISLLVNVILFRYIL